jgi:hypothetical protein
VSVLAYHYTHSPTLARFSDAHGTFVRGLMGPFGSGKSAGCVIELVKWAERQPVGPDGMRRARFAVIRNTYRQLEDTTMRTVEQWLPASAFGTYLKSEHRLVIDRLLPDLHLEILFRALDRPDHVSNLLSLELTGAWVNEAREVPWPIIQALLGRVGRYPSVAQGGCVEPGAIMDTNPPDDDSWWYKQFEEVRPRNWALFRQPGGRSPHAENLPNLRPGYYQDMADSADPDFVRVYVDAEYGYVREGKPVYPSYVDSVHCSPAAEPNEKAAMDSLLFGWDFGLQPAFVAAQQLPNGQVVAFDELTADSIGMEAFADEVLAMLAQRYPWIDHAKVTSVGDPAGHATSALAKENETCFSILRGRGFHMIDGIQVIEIRLGSVKHGLNTLVSGRPRLVVNPRCRMLRRGFQGRYTYKRVQIGGVEPRYHDTPDKNDYSHPHDALQYIAARLFGNLIKGRTESRKRAQINYPALGIV